MLLWGIGSWESGAKIRILPHMIRFYRLGKCPRRSDGAVGREWRGVGAIYCFSAEQRDLLRDAWRSLRRDLATGSFDFFEGLDDD